MEPPILAVRLKRLLENMIRTSSQDSGRQGVLAGYLEERLRERLPPHLWPHLEREVSVPGLAREKKWDLGLVYPAGSSLPKKPRLLISLKSILKNPSGSWPNRLDDLVGEVSSVQLLFPEVVVGYVVVLDYGAPTKRRGGVYRPPQGNELDPVYARFKQGLAALAQRRPPLWPQGLVEGCWVLEIDTRRAPLLLRPEEAVAEGEAFLDALVRELRRREPLIFLDQGQKPL